MIEKHSAEIMNLKGEEHSLIPTSTANIELLHDLEEDNSEEKDELQEIDPITEEKEEKEEKEVKTSPPVLQTILPLVSSMMTLMNNNDTASSLASIPNFQTESIPTIEETNLETEKKDAYEESAMIEEIQSELAELKKSKSDLRETIPQNT